MPNFFFVGHPHHEFHLRYLKDFLGGTYIRGQEPLSEAAIERIQTRDSADAIWFFANMIPSLHPLLKGKQIYIGHGGGFKVSMNAIRVHCLNQYFDEIWSTTRVQEYLIRRAGVPPGKIQRVGHTAMFNLKSGITNPNRIMVSFVRFGDWGEHEILLDCIASLGTGMLCDITYHPQLEPEKVERLRQFASGMPSVSILENQDEVWASCAKSSAMLASSSSIALPFWFQGKPVIFVYGRLSRYPFMNYWQILKQMDWNPRFIRIFNTSTRIRQATTVDKKLIRNAKIPGAASGIFYPHNFNEGETQEIIKKVYAAQR